jgi:hypothetical protein
MYFQLLCDLIGDAFLGSAVFRPIEFLKQTFDFSMVLSDHLHCIGHRSVLLLVSGYSISNRRAALA